MWHYHVPEQQHPGRHTIEVNTLHFLAAAIIVTGIHNNPGSSIFFLQSPLSFSHFPPPSFSSAPKTLRFCASDWICSFLFIPIHWLFFFLIFFWNFASPIFSARGRASIYFLCVLVLDYSALNFCSDKDKNRLLLSLLPLLLSPGMKLLESMNPFSLFLFLQWRFFFYYARISISFPIGLKCGWTWLTWIESNIAFFLFFGC